MKALGTVLAVAATPSHGQTLQFQDGIEVVASRLAQPVARRVIVLTREDIARLPVRSVADLVAWVVGAGAARRGSFGIQADTGLRGATFEQVAVLVNGVRVNDPQTGHFHLDLPYPIEAVEKVTVLLGPGSAVHGPDAFGGVVEVTVAAPGEARARVGIGSFALRDASAVLPVGGGLWAAGTRTTSHGFRPDTEFAIGRGTVGWDGQAAGFAVHLDAAAEDKDLGAWAFYSQRFPDGRERTATAVATLTARRSLGAVTLDLRAGARQHRDVFVLDRQRPDWYRNRHRTESGLVQAALSGSIGSWSWSAGAEGQRERIVSSRLGAHERQRAAVFGEAAIERGGWGVTVQGRADRLGGLGWEAAPALTISRNVGTGVTLAYHGGRSFRQPSFTDLYYVSPDTVGNPELAVESAWSDELLVRLQREGWGLELAAFQRRSRQLIDYLRGEDGIYRATNHAAAVTGGVEATAALEGFGPLSALRLTAAWLDTRLEADPSRSRYAVRHPRVELASCTAVALPFGAALDLALRYRLPQQGGGYAVAEVRVERPLAAGVAVALEASNALDRDYEEVPGVPMPPRWLMLTLSWQGNSRRIAPKNQR